MKKGNGLFCLTALIVVLSAIAIFAYTPPANNRVKYNLDIGWKLNVGDVTGAQATAFNDAAWTTVTLPYAWNQDKAFNGSMTTGIAWYRKHFALPASFAGRKVFVEFEEIRQAGEVYCNGTWVGRHENGVTAFGMDITNYVTFGGADNVIAVKTDNSYSYLEVATQTGFQWNRSSYTTNFGGITQNVYMHVTDKTYQTLPLYSNLLTTGVYIYGKNYNISGKSASITAEAQVKNEATTARTLNYQIDVVDLNGNLVTSFTGNPKTLNSGDTATFIATGAASNLDFWTIGHGALYNVYTILKSNDTVIDVVKTKTGFRKAEYTNGVVKLNDRMIHVKGFAWRSQNPWPALGDAVPAWMCDFQDSLVLGCHGNTVRPMHVAALKQEIDAGDRTGLTYAMPAGDAEGAVTGVQWEQRKVAMRDGMIYVRNNPCVLYWEAGNADISDAQMLEMKNIRLQYDPNGGRVAGCRGMLGAVNPEYAGEMLYVNKSRTIPRWMMEYSRDESPRRWWDAQSAPYNHVDGTDASTGTVNANGVAYNRNQDSYIIEECIRWWEYWTERPGSSVGTGARYNAGGVKIEFCDGTTFNRSDENFRRSGIMDAMRLPKDAYGAFRVMWNGWVEVDNKDVYIVGHWNYAAGITKKVYVVSNCDKVELFVNGVSKGFGTQSNKFLFTFNNIAWATGTVRAVGYTSAGIQKAVDQRVTAGNPSKLKLTVHTSPAGLRATGGDIALIDVEVLDANGVRCPTANNTVSFTLTGPATWRGGMAHGTNNFILATSLPVECGINRVSVRPTATPGTITVQATCAGLASDQVTLTSAAVPVINGLTTAMPDTGLPCNLDTLPSYELLNPAPKSIPVTSVTASAGTPTNTYDDNESTNWSGAWVQYAIASQPVNMVKIKFNGFKATTYPVTISVGGTQVYSGTSYLGLGYWQTTFPATTGNNVRIAATTGSVGIIEAELYGPGTTPVVAPVAEQAKIARVTIQKYPGKVVVTLPGNDFNVNVVDLFGRTMPIDRTVKTGAVSTISFSTKKLAAGMYILDILKASQQFQREKLFIK